MHHVPFSVLLGYFFLPLNTCNTVVLGLQTEHMHNVQCVRLVVTGNIRGFIIVVALLCVDIILYCSLLLLKHPLVPVK